MGHEDWDLSAIVRSCKTDTNNNNEEVPTNTGLDTPIGNQQENEQFSSSFPNLMQSSRTNGFQELHQFFVTSNPTTTTTTSAHGINPNSPPFPDFTARSIEQQQHYSPLLVPKTNYTSIGASSSGSNSFDRFQHQQQPQPQPQEQKQHKNQPQVQVPQTSSSSSMALLQNTQSSQAPRSRKRKSLQKKMVCHVTADNLSADLWAWRKYGQKPIKGSPYPRNYYRCSSCKGCGARKQVERSLTDPEMFVITYTGEHRHAKPVHRNSLAGSTRNKTTQPIISTTRPAHNPESPVSVSADEDDNSSSHRTPMINNQGGRNNDVEGYANIDAEDSWTRDDRSLLTEHVVASSEDDDDDVLIPNDVASIALSDAVFVNSSSFDLEGKKNHTI